MLKNRLHLTVLLSFASPLTAQCFDASEVDLADNAAAFGDHFGGSIATDGEWVVIGAPQSSAAGFLSGAVHVFHDGIAGWSLYQTLDTGELAAQQEFGSDVALSDGQILASAPGWSQDRGAVYVFELTGGTWTFHQRLLSSPMAVGERFGESFDADEHGMVASTAFGGVDVYQRLSNVWAYHWLLGPFGAGDGATFGHAVATDGNRVLVGAPGASFGGSATGAGYLFERQAGAWVGIEVLRPAGAAAGDGVGAQVALGSVPSGRAAVLAHDPVGLQQVDDLATVFVDSGSGSVEVTTLTYPFDEDSGRVGSMALEHGRLALGLPSADAAYLTSGAVVLYAEGPLGWVYESTLSTQGLGGNSRLGAAVDVGPEFVVAGAPFALQQRGEARLWLDKATANFPYCVGAPNSFSALGASLDHVGAASLATNQLVLTAHRVPPGELGLFFYAELETILPFGDGFLCVHQPIYRLGPPVSADASGSAWRHLDFTAPPADSGPGQLAAGDRRYFQFWYRDPAFGGTGFNLTQALSLLVCP